MQTENIRNFSIIAHIDHGKSTLADRMRELTGTVEKRKMREQVLDQMELERERGITIKMQPVRMNYTLHSTHYILNLIDTPGHIDFSYEVSRAQKAVEGAVLLVDATQGVQAQTFTTLQMARDAGLVIIPVLNKIDMPAARVDEVKSEIINLLGAESFASLRTDNVGNSTESKIFASSQILTISAKTGEGVEELFKKIIEKIPPPSSKYENVPRALVFDFEYSNHQGVIVYARVTDGEIKKGDELILSQAKEKFIASEVGIFSPEKKSVNKLRNGEIGYIVTSLKKPSIAVVGDTIVSSRSPLPSLPGYEEPRPVVFSSIYPVSADNFDDLSSALLKLKLSDSSLQFEEESSGALGRGFRCGFLGMLHLEIVTERLRREFNLDLIIATPTVTYEIELLSGKKKKIHSPSFFPEPHDILKVLEPWVSMRIITPPDKVGDITKLLYEHEAVQGGTERFGKNRISLDVEMPLRELMRNFFDELKSVSQGYASLSYKVSDMREAEVVKLDILVAEEIVPAFSKIVASRRIEREAQDSVEKLYKILPRQLFVVKIQGKGLGRIIASRTLSALKKNVTAGLYGGDITRKKKLWSKQKKGKKKREAFSKVNISQEVFLKMMKS